MKPVLSRAGVVLNTAVLTHADVAGREVHCPACGEKTFDAWPEGWKKHAAHCAALESDGVDARRGEFEEAFGHLLAGG